MHTGRFEATIGTYRLTWDRGLPYTYGYDQRRKRAALLDEIAVDGAGPQVGMLSVGPADSDWPILVIEHGHVIPWTEDLLTLDVLLVLEFRLNWDVQGPIDVQIKNENLRAVPTLSQPPEPLKHYLADYRRGPFYA